MDMESKKLILYTMKMNNANQLKLKYTNTKIINLEMYTAVRIIILNQNIYLVFYNNVT